MHFQKLRNCLHCNIKEIFDNEYVKIRGILQQEV